VGGSPRASSAFIPSQLAASHQPPLRLQLGSDCVSLVEGKLGTVVEELDQWRELTLSTDFP
jgi:hypothetical protein